MEVNVERKVSYLSTTVIFSDQAIQRKCLYGLVDYFRTVGEASDLIDYMMFLREYFVGFKVAIKLI